MLNRPCASGDLKTDAASRPARLRGRVRRAAVTLLALVLPLLAGAADQIDYVVQPGDNPWNLTERFLRGLVYWPRLQAFNHIRDATHIPPGTVLHIPVDWLQLTSTRVEVTGVHGQVSLIEDARDGREARDAQDRRDGRDEHDRAGNAGGPEIPLQAGASLRPGSRLVTGPGATVSLLFADDSRVLLLPDSELRVRRADRLAAGGGVILQLQLLRGNLENQVQPRKAPGTRFEIETPAAVAAVRGTQFRVGAEPDRARTEVLEGTVRFANPGGGLDVPAGFGTAARSGAAPQAPTALLPAPDASGAPELIERLPVDAPIGAVDKAQAYRTQFASDAAFTTVLSSETSPAARLRAADLPDGHLYFRVRAIDPDGLEGYAAAGELTVHARPEPPLLVAPPAGAVVNDTRPELRWTARDEPAGYRVQVATDRAFTDPLVDLEAQSTDHIRPDHDLPVGSLWWRMATRTSALGQGPFGDPLLLRRAPPGPDLPPPQVREGELQFAWSATGEGMRYHLELAQDARFDSVLVREVLDQPRFDWRPPRPGRYWLRVAAEASGDLVGPWGSTQSVVIPEPPQRWPWLLLLIPVLLAP